MRELTTASPALHIQFLLEVTHFSHSAPPDSDLKLPDMFPRLGREGMPAEGALSICGDVPPLCSDCNSLQPNMAARWREGAEDGSHKKGMEEH